MALGLTDAFRRMIRGALGLPSDEGAPPDLMRLGLYDARVDVCASDGSTLDVTPLDNRIPPAKNVELRVGIPGAVATVQPNCTVKLGWDRGDPKSPYCVPHWKQGATVIKLVLNATEVYLASESGAQLVALSNKVDAELTKISTTLGSLTGGATVAATFSTPYTRASTAAAKTKAV